VRSDSEILLVLGGTIAIHVLLLVMLDVITVTNPPEPREVAPRVELVEIEVPTPPPPLPPPPEPEVQAPTEPVAQPEPAKPRARTVPAPQVRTAQPPPPRNEDPTSDPGGAQTIQMPDIAPAATGVPVGVGKRTTGPVGRGGTGTGTGTGDGAGSGEAPPKPVSVATIKQRAMPKGDYGYFDAGRDYPPAARQLGIEGVIRVRLVVDGTGKVKSAVLLNKLGHGLDELALARAKKIEFDPATDTDDRPVTSVVVWTFNMTLPK
jgi:periplasmic protein TonB